MSHAQVLSTVGLIRTSRRRGFCPACRLFQTGDGPQEVSAPALIALGFLIVAVVAWTVRMAAMMLPSAMPVVFEFARNAERRRGWRAATALLGMTYLGVWLV